MKKHFVIIAMLIAFGAIGCTQQPIPPPAPINPQEVIVKIESASDLKVTTSKDIQRVQEIPYDEPTFDEHMCKQIGDTLYFPIWSAISVVDTLGLWRNIQVARYKGIKKLHVYVNSGGGGAFDGLGISDVLIAAENEGMRVTTEANGLVASAAVPIFVVGQHRTATAGTIFMIHEASMFKFIAVEKTSDIITQGKMMEMLEARYHKLIADRSKLTVDDLKEKCKATTWFTAKEALEWGLVDEIK